MDEVSLVFRGKIDEWRVHRNNAYLIHCSLIQKEHRLSITDALPLPFDEELTSPVDTVSSLEIYEEAKRAGFV
jgi:hypothetical protein